MSNTHSYLIVGCGRFGRRAVEKLLKKDSRSKIIVVDKDEQTIENILHLPVETAVSDGLLFLDKFLSEGQKAGYIIPAVPFHLAFEFILSQLKPLGAKRRKIPDLTELPNPMKGKSGDLYTSFADFLCPEDCSEPLHCSVTGEHRPKPLFRKLMNLSGPFESKVIHSIQLGPGVGGFRFERLLNLTNELKKKKDRKQLVLISTACRCHGVTSALSF
jgi:hypothetical protein